MSAPNVCAAESWQLKEIADTENVGCLSLIQASIKKGRGENETMKIRETDEKKTLRYVSHWCD